MADDEADTAIVAIVGDTHVNSTIGVMPPYTELWDGGSHRAGPVQRWVWRKWGVYWDEVEALKQQHSAPLYVVANGDCLDDPHHPTTRVVSEHKPTILAMAAKVYERPRQLADHFFVVRGTNAHTGVDACYEELLARDLDAEPDPQTGDASWWALYFEASGVTFDVTHHPQTSGRLPWTEKSAAVRMSHNIKDRYHEMGTTPPDVACRAHVHYFADSGIDTKPRTFYGRPWQLTSSFGHRLGAGQYVRPIGGLIFICRDGEFVPKDCKYQRPKGRPWKAK
jgi:hypothetical protein